MWFVVEAHFKALNVLKSVKKFNEIVSSLTGEFLFVIWSLRPKKYNSHFFWTPCISPYSSLDSLLSGVQWQPTPSTCNYKSPTRLSSPQITEIWTFFSYDSNSRFLVILDIQDSALAIIMWSWVHNCEGSQWNFSSVRLARCNIVKCLEIWDTISH